MTLNLFSVSSPVRVDCTSAADHMEKLSEAIQAAGRGEFSAFKLIGELKRQGLKLIIEEMPREPSQIGISREGIAFENSDRTTSTVDLLG